MASKRMTNDDRRASLLARATQLFAVHGYDELSMAKIAREAGISKPLLYHYFATKRDLFVAALTTGVEELALQTEPDPSRPPAEQLTGSLDAFLRWIDANRQAYAKLMRSAQVPEVRELVDVVRATTATRILDGLGPDGERPATRTAVHAWLWFMDGACLAWVEDESLARDELLGLLLGTLYGALIASGAQPLGSELPSDAAGR